MSFKTFRTCAMGALLALLCCGGMDTFDVAEEASATIEGASLFEQLAGDMGFGSFLNMDISQSQELKNQGVEKNQIDSVKLTTLTLTIADPPSGQDFSFLQELSFFVEAEGLPRKLIASRTSFPSGETSVAMTIEDVELAPYATAPSMNISAEVNGRRPSHQTTIKADMSLKVDVNVSGVACGG
jgi:hypothetical protein